MMRLWKMGLIGVCSTYGRKRNAYLVLVGETLRSERDHLEDLGLDGRILLKSLLENWHVIMLTEFI
jgi:hypothetical protein